MDFRNIIASNVTWQRGGRKGDVMATMNHGKVIVQTPSCPCSVSVHSAGIFRVDMKFDTLNPVHHRFVDWIQDIEEHASGPWRDGLDASSSVYNSNFRIMAFSDTMTFDETGELSADLMNAKKCTALLELTGAWTSNGKWGLRWRVMQIKFSTTCEQECLFVNDSSDDSD